MDFVNLIYFLREQLFDVLDKKKLAYVCRKSWTTSQEKWIKMWNLRKIDYTCFIYLEKNTKKKKF